MRILVLSHMYPSSFDEVGGIFVHEQVSALMKKGVKVRVVSPVPWSPFPISSMDGKWKAYSKIPYEDTRAHVKVYYPRYLAFPRSWFFASSGWRMYFSIQNTISKIFKSFPFDLIHAHVALPDGYAGLLLARRYNKPLVVTIHGQDFNLTVFKGAGSRRAIERVVTSAEKVILVGSKLRKVGERLFPYTARWTVIGNGISPEKIFNGYSTLFDKWKGKRVILSVSHLIRTKGVDINLMAVHLLIKKYPDLYYVIVGSGREKERLSALVEKLGLQKHVEFVGQRSHEEVMEYMSACEIFSLPSWQEGFGIVYIEAMAHGKPVVACQGEGPEDFIEQGRTGMLVEPKDVNSLVKTLDFLLGHPHTAKAMGERARKMVLRNYTWEINAEKTIEVYEEVLNER